MCRYQQKLSESQGGRKEGHRIQYLPPLDSRDNDARRRDRMSPKWGNKRHVVTPMGLWWRWVAILLLQYCIVQCTCVMCRTVHQTAGVSLSETVAVTTCEHWLTRNWQHFENVKTAWTLLLFALFSLFSVLWIKSPWSKRIAELLS